MKRDTRLRAVVTGTRPLGEIHRAVTLLTDTRGIVNAVIYGGRKGRKTALAPLFSFGTFQLYHSPAGDSWSLTESDDQFIPDGINRDLGATYTAAYMCEVAGRISADEYASVFNLLSRALPALDGNPENHRKVLIDFTWKMIQISGISPDFERCPSCDRMYSQEEHLHFSTSLGTPVCTDCADTTAIVLPPGARRYLRYTRDMDFDSAFAVQLYDGAKIRLRDFLISWISFFCQQPLKTVKSGLL